MKRCVNMWNISCQVPKRVCYKHSNAIFLHSISCENTAHVRLKFPTLCIAQVMYLFIAIKWTQFACLINDKYIISDFKPTQSGWNLFFLFWLLNMAIRCEHVRRVVSNRSQTTLRIIFMTIFATKNRQRPALSYVLGIQCIFSYVSDPFIFC